MRASIARLLSQSEEVEPAGKEKSGGSPKSISDATEVGGEGKWN